MKRLLLFGLLLVGCLQFGAEENKASNPINMSIQVVENSPGKLLEMRLEGKAFTASKNGVSSAKNISFVEALKIASFLNGSFLNESFMFEQCGDCPQYEITARLQGEEKRVSLNGQKISGRALELVDMLKGLAENKECEKSDDCVRDGCSGQVCRAKSAPSLMTTCEFRPEFECYKSGECGCFDGVCKWSGETLKCVEEKNAPLNEAPAESAQALCVMKCLESKRSGIELTDGPCLSDSIAEGWACDVVHSPRTPEDNLPQNVCQSLLGNKLTRMVEVDENCEAVRVA